MVGHFREIFRLDPIGIFRGWTLQGYSVVGYCRDTLRLTSAGIFCSWILQGYSVIGDYRAILFLGNLLGIGWIFYKWAL